MFIIEHLILWLNFYIKLFFYQKATDEILNLCSLYLLKLFLITCCYFSKWTTYQPKIVNCSSNGLNKSYYFIFNLKFARKILKYVYQFIFIYNNR